MAFCLLLVLVMLSSCDGEFLWGKYLEEVVDGAWNVVLDQLGFKSLGSS